MKKTKANIYGIVNDSIVDGPGLRLAVFFQGCPHQCRGCHNPQSQTFETKKLLLPEEILSYWTPLTTGLTVSGGEPFSQPDALLSLVRYARETKGIDDIWIWSGWTYEKLLEAVPLAKEILQYCDVLVDGPFIEKLRDVINTPWRGSTNQRLVDVAKSSQANVVELETRNHKIQQSQQYIPELCDR